MDSILIKPTNKKELELLKLMATKMGFSSTILTDADKEDLGLLKAMQEGKEENQYVSRDKVMDKLKSIADSKK